MSIPSVVPRSVPVAARAPRPASRRLLRGMAVASLAAAPLLATPATTSTTDAACLCVGVMAPHSIGGSLTLPDRISPASSSAQPMMPMTPVASQARSPYQVPEAEAQAMVQSAT